MKTRTIVSAIIACKNKFLIAKRAKSKKFAPNKWEFISGFVDNSKTAEEIINNELKDEVNIRGKIVRKFDPYVIVDKEARWIILPFLIKMKNEKFTLNKKDHSEIKWVTLKELKKYKELSNELKQLNFKNTF